MRDRAAGRRACSAGIIGSVCSGSRRLIARRLNTMPLLAAGLPPTASEPRPPVDHRQERHAAFPVSSASRPAGSTSASVRARTTRSPGCSPGRRLPVEVIQEFDTWRRIRDSDGQVGWVFHSLLSGKRTAVVAPWAKGDAAAPIRDATRVDRMPPVTAYLEPGVIGEVDRCRGGWCDLRQGLLRLDRAGPALGRLPGRRARLRRRSTPAPSSASLGRRMIYTVGLR